MGVLSALAILAGLVVVHEAGHFLAATLQGIRVSGFSIGFGPVLLERQIGTVQFALRAIPLGGFVSFPDDEEDSTIAADDPDLLRNRPLPQRALVIAAGVLANLLLAWLVLVGQGFSLGIPDGFASSAGVLVSGVQAGQPAAAAGLKSGDRIVKLQGSSIGGGQSAVQALVTEIQGAPGLPLDLEIARGSQTLSLSLTPDDLAGRGRIGAQLQPNGQELFRPAKGPGEVLAQATASWALLLQRTASGFATLITHFGSTASQVSGPVKIVEMGANLAQQGGGSLVAFAALISINLAVLNALPLPLLDGGQFVLLLLEGLRGRPLPQRFELAFMQSGFVFLVGLSLVLIVKDTSQLAVVQQLLGR
ncbi:MAG: RIP metalloprotease RseP [Prochlorococcaceae cyanobacterium]|jgi:membrane-associated protease RseP (regulator of RpoE activity)